MTQRNGTKRTRGRRIGAASAALLAVAVLSPVGVGAAPAGAPPPDVIISATDGSTTEVDTCGGMPVFERVEPTITVERPNATSGTIQVDVSYTGTFPPGTLAALPGPITIPAGETSTTATLALGSNDSDTLTVTVQPGTGYVVGDPAAATLTVEYLTRTTDCVVIQDEIGVGGQPTDFSVADETGVPVSELDFGLATNPPPGLEVDADGSWSGAATTPGTYRLMALWSQDGLPLLGVTWEITVSDDGSTTTTTTSPTAAAPANAVPGNAAYTG